MLEKSWEHLSPAGPWLVLLVGHGGISGKEDGGGIGGGFNFHLCDAGVLAIELEAQVFIPAVDAWRAEFAGVEGSCAAVADGGFADVDGETAGFKLSGAGFDFFNHESP